MPRVPGCEAVYEVADQWRERCLIQEKSLLWPGLEEPTWTVQNLERARDIMDQLVKAKTTSGGHMEASFSGESDSLKRIVADATAVWNLCPGVPLPNARKGFVGYVASWPQGSPDLNTVFDAIDSNIGGVEVELFHPGFQMHRGAHLRFILAFARQLKLDGIQASERSEVGQLANQVLSESPGGQGGRNMILHLLFPEYYEAIFNNWAKERIVESHHFAATRDIVDIDDRLSAIRQSLEEHLGTTEFAFFDEPVRTLWRPDEDVPFDGTRSPHELEPFATEQVNSVIEELAEKINLMPLQIRQIGNLLAAKKQLIFEGPPGSGKTFIADKFARYFTGNPLDGDHDDRIELVQFHQSYGYEDFVQGIRPETSGGQLTYHVQPGIFLEMCERAENRPDETFVLIIDEINRGNLSRIFGELLMALEYRDKEVRLANKWLDSMSKTRSHLRIPDNLYLIGTMNSTDRSLAMIDYALRRRFYFYPLRPVVGTTAPVLERWLAQSDIPPAEQHQLLAYFIDINRKISDALTDDYQIGHSYFMREQITTDTELRQVWEFALKPLLHEYFHTVRGGADRVEEFAPWQLRPSVASSELEPHGDGLSPDEI